jgi:hypothetical protein|nr:MAG TPA: Receptor Binding Protein [Caudoviricetes sp.]
MAVTYGFYNSLNKDRVYNAEQMSSIFNGIITDGVFASIGGSLMPIAGTGMQVVVKTGKCWFNSTWTLNDALLPLDIPAADVSLTRIDAVVVEINSAVSTRANTIKVIKGTPSANPTKPALVNTETLHQYALGYVTVGAGVTSITADKIEVNVGKTTCPFITSVLQQTDITALFNQWDAEFNTWFANIQSQLSGDIAANLQRQIDELKDARNIKISSECANILNIDSNSSVDDGLKSLGIKTNMLVQGTATLKLKVVDQSGHPVSGVRIANTFSINPGDTPLTDSNGKLTAYIDGHGATISISGYGDIQDASMEISANPGDTISRTLTVTRRNFLKITKSQNIRFSPNCQSIDFALGGAGGGGSKYVNARELYQYLYHAGGYAGGGAGGGGGYVTEKKSVSILPNHDYPVIIGAGGTGGGTLSSTIDPNGVGGDGGISSFLGNNAEGGKHPTYQSKVLVDSDDPESTYIDKYVGGVGNGSGANSRDYVNSNSVNIYPGLAGTQKIYASFTTDTLYGGGGGGGAAIGLAISNCNGGVGGNPGGGAGGANTLQGSTNASGNPGAQGIDNLGGGGGGGACSQGRFGATSATGGRGGNGVLTIRMHLAVS